MEKEFQRVQELKREQKESRKEVAVDPDSSKPQPKAHQEEPREEVAVDPGSREEHYERALKLLREITEENREQTQKEIMKLQIEAVQHAQKAILAERSWDIIKAEEQRERQRKEEERHRQECREYRKI
jgi:lipid A disaccharide synthetase